MTRTAILFFVIFGLGLGTAACGKKSDLEPPQRFQHDARR